MKNNLIIIFILFFAYDSFYLLPFYHMKGVFRLQDVGLLLIGGITLKFIFYPPHTYSFSKLRNPFTWLILIYLLMVLFQISFASMFYHQSLVSGFIAARHQFYYLSFFIFLFMIDGKEDVESLFSALSFLSIILLLISLINYFGPTIFYHKWAEGHNERSGIVRAYIPGISIMGAVGLWCFTKYMHEQRPAISNLLIFLLIYSAIIFRQTRGMILAFTLVVGLALLVHRKITILLFLSFSSLIAILILNHFMEENILINVFASAFEDVAERSGTWSARIDQVKGNWVIIKQHLFFGNGGLVLRDVGGGLNINFHRFAAYGADLGYMSFFKYFGIVGLIWLLFFIFRFYIYIFNFFKFSEHDRVSFYFAVYMFTYIVIAEVTLDSFYRVEGIVILCLILSILLSSAGVGKHRVKSS